jgi:hypothetical protein
MDFLETARNSKKLGAGVFVYWKDFDSGALRNVESGSSIGYCYLLNSF